MKILIDAQHLKHLVRATLGNDFEVDWRAAVCDLRARHTIVNGYTSLIPRVALFDAGPWTDKRWPPSPASDRLLARRVAEWVEVESAGASVQLGRVTRELPGCYVRRGVEVLMAIEMMRHDADHIVLLSGSPDLVPAARLANVVGAYGLSAEETPVCHDAGAKCFAVSPETARAWARPRTA